jgi:hypothetical protein
VAVNPKSAMKRLSPLLGLSICLCFVAMGPAVNSVAAATVLPISVQFVNPGKFTDFQVRGRDANYTASLFADSVRDELRPVLQSKFPNCSLLLRFTNIDLAGRYSTARNTRIVSEGHPARMSFDFVLADASGKVLAKGSTRLNDTSSPTSGRSDPKRSQIFYYERRTLNRWLRTLSTSR